MGDGTQLTGASISHTYASAGTKTVTLGPATLYEYVTALVINGDNLTSISIQPLINLANFQCFNNEISSLDISDNDALVTLYIQNNLLTGTAPTVSTKPDLANYRVDNNLLTGTAPTVSSNPEMLRYHINNNQFSDVPAGMFVGCTKILIIHAQDNGFSQIVVDNVIDQIYALRAIFTNAAPSMNIGGTNAAPSGTYQYSATPSTGKEKIYALVNDDDAEGFNKWTITFTA
jgi:hypothetical protein